MSESEQDPRPNEAFATSAAVVACVLITFWRRIGRTEKRSTGSHTVMQRPGYEDFVLAFHDCEEIGPRMLARIAKSTGLEPDDL